MSLSIIDETANREKIIETVAKIIGKSKDNLRFFEVVYNGKTKIKTQEWVMKEGKFPSTKRVLEIGKKFITAKIVIPVKDETNKIAYEKIDFFSQIKTSIIKLVNRNNASGEVKSENKKLKIETQSYKRKINVKKWDIFICHATEDKESVARPLAKKLQSMDLKVWYDEFELDWGNSLMKSIDNGLKNSQYGIVILSPSFFKKSWPQKELRGLYNLSMSKDEDMILPLLHNLTNERLAQSSPLLSDILYKTWSEGVDAISIAVKKLVNKKKEVKNNGKKVENT